METNQRELKKRKFSVATTELSTRVIVAAKRYPDSHIYLVWGWKNGKNTLLLNGYGAYGASYPASFSSTRLSLLNRG